MVRVRQEGCSSKSDDKYGNGGDHDVDSDDREE